MADITTFNAITPIDGRYRKQVEELSDYFSEEALIGARIEVEVQYLIALSEAGAVRQFTTKEKTKLFNLSSQVSQSMIRRVKRAENEAKHDVKAIEYSLREFLGAGSLKNVVEMIHFGITSEDVNNLAWRLNISRANQKVIEPWIGTLVNLLCDRAVEYKKIPMLARTHGQAALPTTVGKEFANVAVRLNRQLRALKRAKLFGKLNGAVGNYNALKYSLPDLDWVKLSSEFVEGLGFIPELFTTQINPNDDIVELLQIYHRFNTILLDFNQDMWRYISDGWFSQELIKSEVGSSTMPQKVNPINFENSEGNLGLANSLIEHFANKLPVSRLQRDLSGSTVMRNIGSVYAYQLLAYKNTINGVRKISPNLTELKFSLHSNWAILTEAAQTLLRQYGVKNAYDLVKKLSRGQKIASSDWKQWVSGLRVPIVVKKKLAKLKPDSYIGLAVELTNMAVAEIRKP